MIQVDSVTSLFLAAIIFGLSNGISPGPALTLVIAHTLQHNLKEGIKVACGPILFGLIVVPISLVASIVINDFKYIMALISVIGSMYIAYFGFKKLCFKNVKLDFSNISPKSFMVGVLANFSSPYAYIFWFTVGAPLVIKMAHSSWLVIISFVVIYYVFLVGSKIVVAIIVAKSSLFIERGYKHIMRALGIILLIFAGIMLKDGVLVFF